MKTKKVILTVLGAGLITLGFAQGTEVGRSSDKNSTAVNPNIERTRLVTEKMAADKAKADATRAQTPARPAKVIAPSSGSAHAHVATTRKPGETAYRKPAEEKK